MALLEPQHIQVIETDVQKARLTLMHLSDELIDHICCEVEFQMEQNGKTFDEAYFIIKQQTGIQVLQKIQENAFYLIDKKYALMKTTMKITGNVSLALLALGTTFKIFHWPGASPIIILGFILLAFVFFPTAIYVSNKEGKSKNKPLLNFSMLIGGIIFMLGVLFKTMHWPGAPTLLALGWGIILGLFMPILLINKLREESSTKEKWISVLGVVALVFFELGVMFKMFHWPGASVLLFVGSILLVGIFVPLYSKLKFNESSSSIGKYIFLITISMYAVVLSIMLAMNVSSNILGHYVNTDSNARMISGYYQQKKIRLYTLFNSLPDSIRVNRDPFIKKLNVKSESVCNEIERIKLELVKAVNSLSQEQAIKSLERPAQIDKKDNYDWVNHLMIGENQNGFGSSLKSEIEKFRKTVVDDSLVNEEMKVRVKSILNTDGQEVPEGNLNWEGRKFRNNPLMSSLTELSKIEKNVRMIECEVIENLSK